MRKLILLLSALLLCGCAADKLYLSDMCLLAKPISISKADKITPVTLREIWEFNAKYEVLCGVKK
jgi:hypothetical protein